MDRNRRPDIGFVPFTRWPEEKEIPDTNAWEVLPSICVEVVSPTDSAEALMTKLQEYFSSGVQQVWIAYPRHGSLLVYDSPISIRVHTSADTLNGGTALPGFRLELSQLFPNLAT